MTYADLIQALIGLAFVVLSGRSSFRYMRRATDQTRAVLTCVGSGILLALIAYVVPNGTMPGSLAAGLFIGGVLGLASSSSKSKAAEFSPGANSPVRETPQPRGEVSGAAAAAPVMLTVLYPGQFFLVDTVVRVFLDGQPVGTGSVKRGVHLASSTIVGGHDLEVRIPFRSKRYRIRFPDAGEYEVRLNYSRTWGNFSDALDVSRIEQMPTGQVQPKNGG